MSELIQFIGRRFDNDCNWKTGNCYYFAVILKSRFPEGKIFYDVISGHFVFQYQGQYYDWSGLYHSDDTYLVSWDEFDKYDHLQKERIVRDCVM